MGFAGDSSASRAEAAFRAGLDGYLLHTSSVAEVTTAIREVRQGRTYVTPQVAKEVLDLFMGRSHTADSLDSLTVRQREVLQLTAEGLPIKGIAVGATRAEYEYEIPAGEASEMLDNLCERPLIEKMRYRVEHQGLTWEIDEFDGDNTGLIIAEVELEEEHQAIMLPDWVGEEVTGDPRYYNANLIADPFTGWPLKSNQ